MTVYVDPLMDHGWNLRGHQVRSCHLFTDQVDLDELHQLANLIGCKRAWFQEKTMPHYDLTLPRRQDAIDCGAVSVTRREAVEIWRQRRALIEAIATAPGSRYCNECPSRLYCHRLAWCGKQRA